MPKLRGVDFRTKTYVAVLLSHPAVAYLPMDAMNGVFRLCVVARLFLRRCFFMSKKMKKTRKMSQNSRAALIRLTTCAMMVALAIVLCRVLGFPQGGSAFRIEISFLPIAVVGVLYGPIWAAVAYGLTDFIGALLTTGINPFILICKIVFGLLMGLCFYNIEKSDFFAILCFLSLPALSLTSS